MIVSVELCYKRSSDNGEHQQHGQHEWARQKKKVREGLNQNLNGREMFQTCSR